MERGKGSTLSALGAKLVWADHRIAACIKPVLESLASELSAETGSVISSEAAGHRAGPDRRLRARRVHARRGGRVCRQRHGLAHERYFLLCRTAAMDSAAMQVVVAALRDPGLRKLLDALSGYDPSIAGTVTPLNDAFPSLADPA